MFGKRKEIHGSGRIEVQDGIVSLVDPGTDSVRRLVDQSGVNAFVLASQLASGKDAEEIKSLSKQALNDPDNSTVTLHGSSGIGDGDDYLCLTYKGKSMAIRNGQEVEILRPGFRKGMITNSAEGLDSDLPGIWGDDDKWTKDPHSVKLAHRFQNGQSAKSFGDTPAKSIEEIISDAKDESSHASKFTADDDAFLWGQ